MKTLKYIIHTGAILAGILMLSCNSDKPGPAPEPEHKQLSDFTGYYYEGDNGFGTTTLDMHLYNGTYDPLNLSFSGDYEHLSISTFNTLSTFEDVDLETGDYTVKATIDGTPRSIVMGEGADVSNVGLSYYKTRSASGEAAYIITGGTLTVVKEGDAYTLTAEFICTDVAGGAEATMKFKYEGEVNSKFINVPMEMDDYEEFKADDTLRFLRDGMEPVFNLDGGHMFYRDNGALLGSANLKVGYAAPDGLTFYMIEWQGGTSAGYKGGAQIRTQDGVSPLYSLAVVQYENGIVWLVYKASADAPEQFAVQEWL